jgi:sigma-B regulation protein RsbU (phosphoserine phosphatase)
MAKTSVSNRGKVVLGILLALTRKKTLSGILNAALQTACRDFGAEAGTIFLMDRRGGQLQFAAVLGHHTKTLKRMRISPDSGVVGWTVRNGRTALVPDAPKDPRYAPEVSEKIKYPTRNIACVPIKSGKKTVGAVEVINWKGRMPTKAKIERLQETARVLGKVIETAGL